MSDYVTELRREVVAAHAQHRAAGVRTRRRRRRPQVAWAIALVALLVAAVLVVRSIPQPDQSAEPRVVEVVRIGGNPADGVFAAGSLWVTEFARRQVVRIDPARRKVIARIPLDEGPEDITVGGGRIWVSGLTGSGGARVWSIDPATQSVSGRFDTEESAGLAFGGGSVWVGRRGHGAHGIEWFSPAGRRLGSIPMNGPTGLAAAGGAVWAATQDGSVFRLDARSGRVAERWPRLAPNNERGDTTDAFAPDPSGTWLLDAYTDRLLRLEGRGEVARVLRVAADDSSVVLARAGNHLWVVADDDPTGSRIVRLDARTGKATAAVPLGTHYPRALVPAPGGLWVVAGDGTVVLVAG